MTKLSQLLIRFLLVVILWTILLWPVSATSEQFNVFGGGEETRTLKLAVDDHVLIDFHIVGKIESHLTCPNGTVESFDAVGELNYRFVCVDDGDYVLHFSNPDSSQSALVTLDYEIQHYILGMPQMLFLTLVIVVVCMAAVAVFILMGKPR